MLLVEDSPDDEELLLLELERNGYDVYCERVEAEGPMRQALARTAWDIVISDHSMPCFSGPAALALVRSTGLDIPFIIVSGTVGEETAVNAMKSGANDYVLKGSLTRLCPAIERELREVESRAEQRRTQEQLLISDRMASVGTLAAGVAHEINNPLVAIIANLQLVTRGLAKVAAELDLMERLGAVFDELQDAREGAERLRNIVQDLKLFSRSPEEERRGPVDVARVLDSSLRMAKNEIHHRARLLKEYGDVPPVAANEARLGQVFLNLIVNAAQAIPVGDADNQSIRVVTSLDPSGQVAVEIHDTGAGIAPEEMSRIFDAFYTTKPIGVGTGLGLSICHRIVTGLGGQIRVESQVGQGTVFRLLLPAAARAIDTVLPPRSADAAKRRGRVLVIDDEAMIGRAVKRTLERDHEVLVASSGREALERFANGERFDVILCDLMMPQMTGMELHAELMRLAPDTAGQMIFLTGGAFTPGAREFLRTIPNQCLDKPFDTTHLLELVNGRVQ